MMIKHGAGESSERPITMSSAKSAKGEEQPSLVVIMRHLEFTDDTSRNLKCIPLTTNKLMNRQFNNMTV